MDEHNAESDATSEEPNEVGWYAYSGGAQAIIFHLRETGQWSAHFDNGTAADCAWGYIEQAFGVWSLVRLVPGAVCSCESSPPEFGGNLPDRECPLHGEHVTSPGSTEDA
jgi:hypothetical protein